MRDDLDTTINKLYYNGYTVETLCIYSCTHRRTEYGFRSINIMRLINKHLNIFYIKELYLLRNPIIIQYCIF